MTTNNLDFGALADFAHELHVQPDEKATVQKVLEFALAAVGADHAGVLITSRKERAETPGASDPDVDSEQRWPEWSGPAADLGARSVLEVRIGTGSETFGTLNVYARRPDAFTAEDREILDAIARLAAVALSAARKEQNLWRAIDSRKLVGQAQGILMERFELDADQAFAVLVRYSQTQNVKVATIAEELIRTRSLLGDD